MIELLTGDNGFAIEREVRSRREAFAGDAELIDAADLTVNKLPDLFMGATLFSPERLVVIRGASANKSLWNELETWLERANDDTHLVFVDSKPDKRTKTFKAFQKHATVFVHPELDETALIAWVQAHAREMGLNIEVEAARYLVQYTGTDQWRLHHDIGKLVALGKPVTPELIRDVLEPEPRASAFDVLDAALSGRRDVAQSQLDILATQEDAYRFFGLLSSQVYAIAVCKAGERRSPDQIAKAAGIHPFVVKKTLALVRRYERYDVRRLVELVADCDVRMKSSGTDPWLLMKLTIGAIATR